MKPDPNSSPYSVQLLHLADVLSEIRDTWVEISLSLSDLATEMPSPERDEIMSEVERYLNRLREGDRRSFD